MTNAEMQILLDESAAHARRTTVTYGKWRQNVKQKKYANPDLTEWGAFFRKMAQASASMPAAAKTLADAAVAHAKRTTISYPSWKAKLDAGAYADPLATEWGAMFDKIARARKALDVTLPPPPPKPTNTVKPVLSGVAKVGETLRVTTGEWSPAPATFQYVWHRCDANGTNCAKSPTSTNAPSYVLTAADVGHTIIPQIAPDNDWAAAVNSARSAVVVDDDVPPPPPPPPPPESEAKGRYALRYGGHTGSLDGLTRLDTVDMLVVSSFKINDGGVLLSKIRAENPKIKILVYKAASELGDVRTGTGWSANQGVTYAEAQAHDAASAEKWILKDANGQPITPWYGYDYYWGGDPGFQSFQDRWYQNVKATILGLKVDGVFVDNMLGTLPRPVSPAKYPTALAWQNAMAKFVEPGGALKRLKDEGFIVYTNTHAWVEGDHGSNDASLLKNWWRRVAPGVSGMMNEYWMQNNGSRLGDPRLDKPAWDHYYRNYVTLVDLCQELGVGFMGHSNGASHALHEYMGVYARAAFLLRWNGKPELMTAHTIGGSVDDYAPYLAFSIGTPGAPETEIAPSVFRRYYTAGAVWLNSHPTASHTISSSPDGRAYKTHTGAAVSFPVTLAPGRALIAKI